MFANARGEAVMEQAVPYVNVDGGATDAVADTGLYLLSFESSFGGGRFRYDIRVLDPDSDDS